MDDKKRTIYFIIIVVLIAGLSMSLYFGYEKGLFGSKKSEPINEPVEKTIEQVVNFNGIYENGENTITLYTLPSKEVYYYVEGDSTIEGNASVSGTTATGKIFETYTFTLKDGNVEFSSTDPEIVSAVYTKKSDFTKEDYYKAKCGDASYINSEYNGKYKFDNATLYLYQKDNATVRIIITKGFSFSDLTYEIKDDKSLYTDLFDDSFSAKIEGDTLVFTTIKGEKTYDGTYTKISTLTMDDIINEFA